MSIRFASMLLAAALVLPCQALAAPPPPPGPRHGPPPMVKELLDCGRIHSSSQRLMCYDRLKDKVKAREASHRRGGGTPPPPPPPPRR